jgi:hypothetical protein
MDLHEGDKGAWWCLGFIDCMEEIRFSSWLLGTRRLHCFSFLNKSGCVCLLYELYTAVLALLRLKSCFPMPFALNSKD